jgi:hypothetical protein
MTRPCRRALATLVAIAAAAASFAAPHQPISTTITPEAAPDAAAARPVRIIAAPAPRLDPQHRATLIALALALEVRGRGR